MTDKQQLGSTTQDVYAVLPAGIRITRRGVCHIQAGEYYLAYVGSDGLSAKEAVDQYGARLIRHPEITRLAGSMQQIHQTKFDLQESLQESLPYASDAILHLHQAYSVVERLLEELISHLNE